MKKTYDIAEIKKSNPILAMMTDEAVKEFLNIPDDVDEA